METFHWDHHFETGLQTIDEQHQGLVTLINRFSSIIEERMEPDPSEISRIYDELGAYAKTHFATERSLMELAGLDPRFVTEHLKAHGTFLLEVGRIRQVAGERFADSAKPLLNYLVHWLAYHILGTDQSMARQIAAVRGGASPAVAYLGAQMSSDSACSPLLTSLSGLFDVVSDRNRALFEMNQHLEDKVHARTLALEEMNHHLQDSLDRLRREQEQTLRLSQELAQANLQLEQLAMTDLLTGLYNRRYAMDRLAAESKSALRHGDPLSLVLLDADGFKAINDTHGHDAGDEVLKALAASLKALFRQSDVVCRMGGDEFLVICPRVDRDGAGAVAERVRRAVASQSVPAGTGTWRGSLSIGVAEIQGGATDISELIKRADMALYQAKREGRDRVVIHRDSTPA